MSIWVENPQLIMEMDALGINNLTHYINMAEKNQEFHHLILLYPNESSVLAL